MGKKTEFAVSWSTGRKRPGVKRGGTIGLTDALPLPEGGGVGGVKGALRAIALRGMIPPRGGDFAVAAVLPEGRLRRFSRLSQGSERKRCHGRVAKERFLARFEELVGARAA